VHLSEELDLVAIKFQGARLSLGMGGDGFRADVAMKALQVMGLGECLTLDLV
jgi:hypothetical protein